MYYCDTVHVSISHRLFQLNNKSRVTTANCSTVESPPRKKKEKSGEGECERSRMRDTPIKCHAGNLKGGIFTRNNPFRNGVISIRDYALSLHLDFKLLHPDSIAKLYCEVTVFFFIYKPSWRRDVVLCEDDVGVS